jgi:hypothetical protein
VWRWSARRRSAGSEGVLAGSATDGQLAADCWRMVTRTAASNAFATVVHFCMPLLYGRTGSVTAKNSGFRPGQATCSACAIANPGFRP